MGANTTLADIRSALPSLSADQRGEVVRLCKALGIDKDAVVITNGGGNNPKYEIEVTDWLADGIVRKLRERGLITTMSNSPQVILGPLVKYVPEYPRESAAMREWVLSKFPPGTEPTNSRKLMWLGDTLISALITTLMKNTFLEAQGLSPTLLMRHIKRIPQAIDAELPGYLQNGLLHTIAR